MFIADAIKLMSSKLVDLYQKWSGYPDSPDLTSAYPYQCIGKKNSSPYTEYLWMSKSKIYVTSNTINLTVGKFYYKSPPANEWTFNANMASMPLDDRIINQANSNIYTDSALTTVYFAQTTP